jgi:hypothetical protein
MGAVSSVPQGVMQGVQQISQMAGGKDGAESGPSPEERRPDERSAEDRQAAGSDEHRERVPESAVGEVPQANSVAPDQPPAGPRHAAPDPAVDV